MYQHGQALAVDREEFAKLVTKRIKENENIEVIHEEIGSKNSKSVEEMANEGIVIIATGPLTSDNLSKQIAKLTGTDKLYFYDAAAPIVTKESINMKIAFWGDRYEQERKKEESIEDWQKRRSNIQNENYINLPMNKEEYENFYNELINEKREIFEGCMPLEVMAKRGIDTLRFGPLKPVGFTDPRTRKAPICSDATKTR